ncbi:MAG: hypothetical protein JNJ73_03615 [Hyphomonadaceae bacterium]|nr:hypothetical protein [Hyphomonadaceae bacterium]
MAALKKAGGLAPGSYHVWRWSVGEHEIASIGVRGAGDGVRLIYVASDAGRRQSVDQYVAVHWRPCRLGGVRAFFQCPRCERSILNLHLATVRFLCRCCARLTYLSRRERAQARHLRMANRLRRKLGGAPGVQSALGERPKHMRHRTYKRIIAEIEDREALAMAELAAFLLKTCSHSR